MEIIVSSLMFVTLGGFIYLKVKELRTTINNLRNAKESLMYVQTKKIYEEEEFNQMPLLLHEQQFKYESVYIQKIISGKLKKQVSDDFLNKIYDSLVLSNLQHKILLCISQERTSQEISKELGVHSRIVNRQKRKIIERIESSLEEIEG